MTSWQAGDWLDRKAILLIAAATIFSTASYQLIGGFSAILLVGIVDVVLLVVIVQYALRSARYWPIWFAGFHGVGLTMNLLRLIAPDSYAHLFGLVTGFCGVAALISMVVGLLADQKRGVTNTGGSIDQAVLP